MRKLEDIPKKSVFKVPDGYFDQLPAVIQSRMVTEKRTTVANIVSFSFKFALPVVALIVASILWLRPEPSFENQLADIDTEQIALYLNSTDHVDLEETIDTHDFTNTELDQLRDTIYSNLEYPNDDLLDDIDLDNL